MIDYRITDKNDIDLLMQSRLEMLRVVNGLDDSYEFDEEIVSTSRDYFLNGEQTTVLALDNGKVAGCASICYYTIMPTYSHPTGKRSHVMNVFTEPSHRRKGIGKKMMEMLIADAKKHGATEISLDATDSGRPLYEALGFKPTEEGMVLVNE